jgi:hypothetical protein
VLVVGAGLARPIFKPSRKASARVIVADESRNVTDAAALRDSVKQYYRDGDAIVVFDSSARVIHGVASDSLVHTKTSKTSGNLSAGLIAAFRAASELRDNADSLELVVVSPFAAIEMDAATDSIRSLWPGRARMVKAGFSEPAPVATSTPLQLRGTQDDPLAISVAKLAGAGGINSRIVRDGLRGDDLSWADSGQRGLVDWPVSGRPRGAISRAKVDTVGGVISGLSIVVAAFPRKWIYPTDSIRGGEVVARWVDGEPAAVEWQQNSGCVRSVSIPVNPVGDLSLSTTFVRFAAAMSRVCAAAVPYTGISQAEVGSLAGTGRLAPRDAFEPRDHVRSTLAPWLLGMALILAVAELFVRRRNSEGRVSAAVRQSGMGRAA